MREVGARRRADINPDPKTRNPEPKTLNQVWAWGGSPFGQLGHGGITDILRPTPLLERSPLPEPKTRDPSSMKELFRRFRANNPKKKRLKIRPESSPDWLTFA